MHGGGTLGFFGDSEIAVLLFFPPRGRLVGTTKLLAVLGYLVAVSVICFNLLSCIAIKANCMPVGRIGSTKIYQGYDDMRRSAWRGLQWVQ